MSGYSIIEYDSLRSTNEQLKALLAGETEQSDFTCIFAHAQSEGKGQAGNVWNTDPGKNIICSLLIYPKKVPAPEQFIISKAVAVAIVRYLSGLGVSARIKWPNDIYVEDSKICGVLIENQLQGEGIKNAIIGIGLNLNQIHFPEWIPNPVSARMVTKNTYVPIDELNKLIPCIINELSRCENDGVCLENDYFNLLYRNEGEHLFESNGEQFFATICSVARNGAITLKRSLDGNYTSHYFKEIQYCL